MNKIDRFFFNTIITQYEKERYSTILQNYITNISDEHKLILELVEEARNKRDTEYSDLYDTVERVIKGEIFTEEEQKAFIIKSGSAEALNIMNLKAAVFDVSQIDIELKQVKINPNDKESGVEETFISIFNRILNESYLQRQQYKTTFSDAIRYSRGYPMAISLIGWDDNATLGAHSSFRGDITCENIPIRSFYWDPSANSLETCEYVYITKILPFRTIYAFLNKLSDKNLELLESAYVMGNITTPVTEGSSSLVDNQILINNGAVELLTVYVKKYDNNGNVSIKLYHIMNRQYVVGTQSYDIPYLPFSILKENASPDNFTGISSVMMTLSDIKKKHIVDNVATAKTIAQKNITYIYSTTSGIKPKALLDWESADSMKALATNADPQTSVHILAPPSISGDLLTWRQMLSADIDSIANSTDMSNFGSKLSGQAVQNVVQQSTIKENTSIIELEKYLVRFVRIMLSFLKLKLPKMKNQYLEFRAKNNVDKKNTDDTYYELISLSPDEFEELEADVIIDASLLRTSRKQQQQQDMMKLYQLELQYKGSADFITIKDIIQSLNLPNKEAVIQRLSDANTQKELQLSMQMVQIIMQLMQSPEYEGITLEQAVQMAYTAINEQAKQGGK